MEENHGSDVALSCSDTDQALFTTGHFQMPYQIVRDGKKYYVELLNICYSLYLSKSV